ncbi:hypothetical protein [Phormidesmis sp. 146-33]
MRRFFVLVLVASCFNLLYKQTAAASTTQTVDDPSRSYWIQAQKLAQDQVFLLNRIEQALVSPDANRIRAVRGQIFLYTSAVDRFLKSNFPEPNVMCAPPAGTNGQIAGTDAASPEEAQVYCALYASTQALNPLRARLDQRAFAQGSTRQVSLSAPSDPKLPIAEPAIVGKIAKTAIANQTPSMIPAVVPPDDIVSVLQSSRQRLVEVQSVFPTEARFMIPVPLSQSDRNPYDLYPSESKPFASFLAQPETGIARLLPTEVYRTASNTQNRLLPTALERFPLATLIQREGLSPRLAVRVEGDLFQLIQADLDYGFMTDLGDVAIESLTATPFEKLSAIPEMLRFFYTYRPPSELEAVQVDRRRFITGKVAAFNLSEPLLTQAPAATNRTYLVRSIQYKVPELITSGRTLLPTERRRLKDLLTMPSSDVLFAFRPVSRRSDGSYTVLWRVLTKFPDPQVRDLDRYVEE